MRVRMQPKPTIADEAENYTFFHFKFNQNGSFTRTVSHAVRANPLPAAPCVWRHTDEWFDTQRRIKVPFSCIFF